MGQVTVQPASNRPMVPNSSIRVRRSKWRMAIQRAVTLGKKGTERPFGGVGALALC